LAHHDQGIWLGYGLARSVWRISDLLGLRVSMNEKEKLGAAAPHERSEYAEGVPEAL
jgi:hypothetical protein